MFERSWVPIPAPYSRWTFFTLICPKIELFFLKKTKNKRKRGRGWPIKNISGPMRQHFKQVNFYFR